jgi:hypothetical protein
MRKSCFLASLASVVGVAVLPSPAVGQVPGEDSVSASAPSTASGYYRDIEIDVRSGPTGENPSGTASFTVSGFPTLGGGAVKCLRVAGNTATMNVTDASSIGIGAITIQVTDNAGTGAPDHFDSVPLPLSRAPDDCSPLAPSGADTPIATGDITVVDAPAVPTVKHQCKNNGWRDFPGFKSVGQCIAFVQRGPRPRS